MNHRLTPKNFKEILWGKHRFIPPILWMVVIFAASSIPGPAFPKLPWPGFDKLVHLIEYSVLGFLWSRAFDKRTALVIGIIYGVLDEIHQIYVPYREFSILDITVDGIGVILGLLWHSLLKR